jgi:uncharacterized protein (TIGR02246 family)
MIGPLLKASVASAVVAVMIGCSMPRTQTSQSDEEAIRSVIAEMTDGFNRHDAAAATHMYTPDGDFVSARGDHARGRAEVERLLATIFETKAKYATIQTGDFAIRFIRPDVALVYVTNELSGLVTPNGQKLPPHRELSLRVFVKDNGRWQVAALQNTMVNPLKASKTGGTRLPAPKPPGYFQPAPQPASKPRSLINYFRNDAGSDLRYGAREAGTAPAAEPPAPASARVVQLRLPNA